MSYWKMLKAISPFDYSKRNKLTNHTELCGEWEDFGGKDVRRQNPLTGLSPYDYSKRNIVTDHTEPRGGGKE